MKAEEFVECGCCSAYHKKDYDGDCRNDAERYYVGNNDQFISAKELNTNPKPSHTATPQKGKHPENIIIDMDGIICAICERQLDISNSSENQLFCDNCRQAKPFIVKCVNAHEKVLTILQKCLKLPGITVEAQNEIRQILDENLH